MKTKRDRHAEFSSTPRQPPVVWSALNTPEHWAVRQMLRPGKAALRVLAFHRTVAVYRCARVFVAAALLAFTYQAGAQLFTPPMGWNSYDTFGDSVTEEEVLANAGYMKEHLLAHGWNYVVIDFRWYDPQPTGDDRLLNKTRTGAALTADEFGRLLPATNRFPSATGSGSFKPLAGQLHAMGLKFGIHVMRGVPRQAALAATPMEGGPFTAADAANTNNKCDWCPDMFGARTNDAAQQWYNSCARLWTSWGVDYIKVDDLSSPYHGAEIEMIRKALDKCGRPIAFSTSPGPTPVSQAAHISAHANLWRISGDFWDNWRKLRDQFNLLARWQAYGGVGHWPDADMIPLGHLCIRSKLGGNDHRTHFTSDEQRTLMALWSLAPSPLMFGGNLPDNDEFTLSLLTNDEVLAINRDALGTKATFAATNDTSRVFARELSDGDRAAGLFNLGGISTNVVASWTALQLSGAQKVRDLWLHKELGTFENEFSASVEPHGVVLVRFSPARK